MVQGGYNVALAPGDSAERHFMDTIEGGKWLNNQDLAWLLVTEAQTRIRELETRLGCFFDRNPDGTVHQKAFAGQTFDRTIHNGDLTGIEIINRLAEQAWRRDVRRLEDHRALDFIPARDGSGLAAVLMLDMRSGEPVLVRARATLLEEGLRGAGGWLLDSTGERFMFAYDARGERATRDIVSRSIQDRIRKGFATLHGGVWIQMA